MFDCFPHTTATSVGSLSATTAPQSLLYKGNARVGRLSPKKALRAPSSLHMEVPVTHGGLADQHAPVATHCS